MGKLVNLRRARKEKERALSAQQAAANRASHGAPKQVRERAAAETRHAKEKIDAHRLDDSTG